MYFAEIADVASDIAVTIAALVTSYVALIGLGAWRQQLRGQNEHELARRLLISLYKFRDSIDHVRHPAMWGHEMDDPPAEESSSMDYNEKRHFGLVKAYERRWDKVNNARAEIRANIYEAEAIWDSKVRDIFEPAMRLEHELLRAVQLHVELCDPTTSDSRAKSISERMIKHRDILYDSLTDEPDGFKAEFYGVISSIEEFLRPKLVRK